MIYDAYVRFYYHRRHFTKAYDYHQPYFTLNRPPLLIPYYYTNKHATLITIHNYIANQF